MLMSLARFTEINQIITIISKNDISNNKLKKDCKVIKYFEDLFKKVYEPGGNLPIDEGMMPIKGKLKNKVYNLMKPGKWGIEFYICAESNTGYVLHLWRIR
jgi:hypothetical protein